MGYPIAEMPSVDVAADETGQWVAAGTAPAETGTAMATIGPPRLPAVPPLAARAARLACDAGLARRLAREAGMQAWHAQVRSAPEPSSARFEAPGVLDLAHQAGTIRVLLDLAAYPALEIAALPEDAHAAPPRDAARALRSAVAGVLLEPLLERLAALGLGGLHVAQVLRAAAPEIEPREHAIVDVSFTLDGRQHSACVLLPAPVLGALEAWHATRGTHARAGNSFADTLVPGRLILGSRRLPVETLRALASGDVLLRSLAANLRALMPDGIAAAAPMTNAQGSRVATAIAAWGTPGLVRVHVPVNLDGLKLSITKEPTMADELDPVRPDDLLAPDQEDNPIDIGELDLPVQFEVDTVALPLSQLYALRPGYVLELPTPVSEARLKLVTHGQTIGYGELVTVGDHLGIRILRMAHGDGPVQ